MMGGEVKKKKTKKQFFFEKRKELGEVQNFLVSTCGKFRGCVRASIVCPCQKGISWKKIWKVRKFRFPPFQSPPLIILGQDIHGQELVSFE